MAGVDSYNNNNHKHENYENENQSSENRYKTSHSRIEKKVYIPTNYKVNYIGMIIGIGGANL